MSALEAMWWREQEPAGARALLAPLALAEAIFRAGAALRAGLYRAGLLAAERAGAPVISVGNLAVGGAGKTPAAIAVARRLQSRGRRVAVLSRGYRATRREARVVSDGRRVLLGAADAGDEPLLLARRLPGAAVLCGPRRAPLARRAVEALGADALVLDDGFQHRALWRDLDLVVLDAANPFGNGRLLPRGPNREGLGALDRAGLAWLSRVDQAAPDALGRLRALAAAATGRPPVESRHAAVDVVDGGGGRSFGPAALAGRRVLLLAALARPGGFRRTVEGMGASVAAVRFFRDHHLFTDGELEEAFAAGRAAGCDQVVATEKDAVRLPARWAGEGMLRVVRIEAEVVRGEEILAEALDRALAAWPSAAPRGGPR
ncbi:MAG TPA: tetraacyldisaccharide 4'-kinase [Anaeromyxobacteraceae bacterium]